MKKEGDTLEIGPDEDLESGPGLIELLEAGALDHRPGAKRLALKLKEQAENGQPQSDFGEAPPSR